MKILFSSHFFPPGVGGIEEVGELLAHQFARAGHEVIVVTRTPGKKDFPFQVRRRAGPGELVRLTRWSDVVFHNNISLQTAWPLLGIRRPWVVTHHTWIARPDGRLAAVDKLKLRVIRAAACNVAVSEAIAASLDVPARVIQNPYRDEVFRTSNRGDRAGQVIFVGRLVSDKGADLLVEALGILKRRGVAIRATVVGDGPERQALEEQARALGIDVSFAGVRRSEELARMLNDHRVLVVPSRWEEPFGIVALEAMACGCVPLVARSGGLPEAVGEAGAVFEKGNAEELAALIEKTTCEAELEKFRQRAAAHMERHRAQVIAQQYLKVLEEAAR